MKNPTKTVRRLLFIILAITLLSGLCTACNSATEQSLVVSIPPLKGLTEEIAGEGWHVHSLVPPGQNPEDYEPTIEDMMHLEDARVILHLSLPAEKQTLDKIQENYPDKPLIDLSSECASLMEPIQITDTQLDPHLWLSPKRALLLTEVIRDTLISLDEHHANVYQTNQEQLAAKLNELDEIWESTLSQCPEHTFLIYHPALSYLALDYGLEMISIEQHGKEPDIKELDQTIRLAKEKNIGTVLFQQEFPREKAEAIAHEIGADTIPLSLLNEDYFAMMYDLLEIIKTALRGDLS